MFYGLSFFLVSWSKTIFNYIDVMLYYKEFMCVCITYILQSRPHSQIKSFNSRQQVFNNNDIVEMELVH